MGWQSEWSTRQAMGEGFAYQDTPAVTVWSEGFQSHKRGHSKRTIQACQAFSGSHSSSRRSGKLQIGQSGVKGECWLGRTSMRYQDLMGRIENPDSSDLEPASTGSERYSRKGEANQTLDVPDILWNASGGMRWSERDEATHIPVVGEVVPGLNARNCGNGSLNEQSG